MSLIAHHRHGELGRWMAAEMPGASQVAAIVRVSVAERRSRVLLPAQRIVDPAHWSGVDAAFRLRLAFAIDPAPPYSALYGAALTGLTDQHGVNVAAACFPTHRGMGAADRRRSCQLRRTADGWFDTGAPPGTDTAPAARDGAPTGAPTTGAPATDIVGSLCADVAERLTNGRDAAARPGAELTHGRSQEVAFARLCWALGTWQQAYRTGDTDLAGRAATAGELLAMAPEPVVEDLVELVAYTRRTGALDEVRALAEADGRAPVAVVEPALVPHWAEGDLVVGNTLLCVQSPVVLRAAEHVSDWLRQLLVHAWLDVDDRYRIRRVGLYLARQARLITWSLETFAAALLQTTVDRIERVRREFLTLAARAAATDGIDARWFRTRAAG